MSAQLQEYLHEYLQLRRIMGHRLARHQQLITSFLDFLSDQHSTKITVDLALQWACLPQGTTAQWHATRLSVVRLYAAYVHAADPGLAEIIPPKLITTRVVRSQPYIYTPRASPSAHPDGRCDITTRAQGDHGADCGWADGHHRNAY